MAASTPQVALDALLEPISTLMPSGESLRRSFTYDQIKEARRADDPNLAQGVWQTDVKRADWGKVADLCVEALEKKSKDLRIAAWLAEAWLKRHGPSGAAYGFNLIEGLVERFWDTLHPPIEDDDLDGRMAPLMWINEKLSVELKAVSLTDPQAQEPEHLSWNDWEKASMIERSGHKPGPDDVTTSHFMTCVLLTPGSFYRQLDRDLSELWEATASLEAALDKRCGQPMAALWQFRETLTSIREFVGRALDQKAEEEPEADTDEAPQGEGATMAMAREDDVDIAQGKVRWGPIRNRAEAYQRLAEAADYLMRKEPHSPTPHLVRRAVSWGNMSFAELIQELVQDQTDLRQIYALLGMPMPGDF